MINLKKVSRGLLVPAFLLGVALVVLLAARPSSVAVRSQIRCEIEDGAGRCVLYRASLIELLARPAAFHGKKVRVIGFLKLEFEGDALYLHAEDEAHGLTNNGVWVDIPYQDSAPKLECKSGSYVLMEGIFNAEKTGHLGLWSGGLEEISRCQPWH